MVIVDILKLDLLVSDLAVDLLLSRDLALYEVIKRDLLLLLTLLLILKGERRQRDRVHLEILLSHLVVQFL